MRSEDARAYVGTLAASGETAHTAKRWTRGGLNAVRAFAFFGLGRLPGYRLPGGTIVDIGLRKRGAQKGYR